MKRKDENFTYKTKIEIEEEISMLDGVFARGTTPTQIFPIPGELTKSDLLDFTISYRQKHNTILIKRKEDSYDIPEIDSEKNIIVVLS